MFLDAVDTHLRQGAAAIAAHTWEMLAGFVEAAIQHQDYPDQGIWEIRAIPNTSPPRGAPCHIADPHRQSLPDRSGARLQYP
jgi:hypothetical protein